MTLQLLQAPLPPGLRAIARRGRDGRLIITLNKSLSPAQQRAAVREIRRTAGRKGWLLPGIVIPVAAAAIRAGKHPAALAALGAAVGTAAALAVFATPSAPGLRPVQQMHPAPGSPGGTPVVAVARPHSHRRRDGAAASTLPAGRHVTLPASSPSPAALVPSLVGPVIATLPHVHAKVHVKVQVPPLPLLPVPLPSPTVGACVNLRILGDGVCVNVAA